MFKGSSCDILPIFFEIGDSLLNYLRILFLGHHQMSIEKSLVSSGKSLYQEDFYRWLQETANLLERTSF
jgi:hypothetical protein